MRSFWRLPAHIQHFPAANPMSIEEKDFARLAADDFLAALKTDGVRFLLLLTCKPNSTDPIAIMIDRKKAMYEVEVWANEDFFFRGSLYDGELVWEKDNLAYVVFDVILTKGVSCTRLSYRERMHIVHNTILCVSNSHSDAGIEQMIAEESKFLARNNDNNLRFVPKKCVPKSSLRALWEQRNTAYHRNDGIIFTCNLSPVETGTSSSILKWKPCHSIDVHIAYDEKTKDWTILANDNNSGNLVCLRKHLAGREVILRKSKLLEAIGLRQPCIMECIVVVESEATIELIAERERTDKCAPNTTSTIDATIRNAIENISSEDLFRLVQE